MKSELFAGLVEILAAAVISIAAVMTSWASFQSALWDGEQAARYTEAGAARIAAARAVTTAGQAETADLLMFQQWLGAEANHQAGLKVFYRQRFRPEFAVAFEAWAATDPAHNPAAPSSPFAMPQYHPARLAQSQALQKQADALFDEGQHDNDVSDCFVQVTVLLAIALFFGGISQTFKSPAIKTVLVGLAGAVCVFSAVQLMHLPCLPLKGF